MGLEGGAKLVHEGDGLLEQPPSVALMARPLGDTGEVLARRGRAPHYHRFGVRVGVEHQVGDVLRGVACKVPTVLHPVARPVDLPGYRQAWAPEVAVDNKGGGSHTVEQRQQYDVPPLRTVGGKARAFGRGPVGF